MRCRRLRAMQRGVVELDSRVEVVVHSGEETAVLIAHDEIDRATPELSADGLREFAHLLIEAADMIESWGEA